MYMLKDVIVVYIFKIKRGAGSRKGFEKVGDGLAHVLLIASFGR